MFESQGYGWDPAASDGLQRNFTQLCLQTSFRSLVCCGWFVQRSQGDSIWKSTSLLGQVFGRGTDPDTYSISMYIPWHMQHMLMPCHVTAHPGDKYAVYSYYGTFARAMLTLFDAWTDKNLGSGTKVQAANLTPGVEIGS